MTRNNKTRNRAVAVSDLARLGLEQIPAVGVVTKVARVTKDVYTITTGRRLRLSDLPTHIRRGEMSDKALERRLSKRFL